MALGHRPSSSAAAVRAQQQQRQAPPLPGAAALAASLPAESLPQRQPFRHLHQQQARLTPMAVPGSKQQRAASVEPGQDLQGPAADTAMECDRDGSTSPMQVAEPSQQLGLSPGAADAAAALDSQQGGASEQPASPAPSAAAGAAPAAPVVIPALPATPLEPHRGAREQSGAAAEWQHLLDCTQLLVEEMAQADPQHPGFRPDPVLTTPEQQYALHRDVVSAQGWAGARRSCDRPLLREGN